MGETDPNTDPDPFGGLGVLKSTDGGKSWRILDQNNGLDFLYIGSLYMHPEDPDILLAAAGRLVPELAFQHMMNNNHSPLGIYRTEDGGEHWTKVLEGEGDILVQTFSVVECVLPIPRSYTPPANSRSYRRKDAGLTWTLQSGGSQGWGPPGVRAGIPIDFQCDPRDTDRVFANNYRAELSQRGWRQGMDQCQFPVIQAHRYHRGRGRTRITRLRFMNREEWRVGPRRMPE